MARHETTSVTAVIGGDGGFGTTLVEALVRRAPASAVRIDAGDDPDELVAALDGVTGVSAVVHVCGDDATTASGPLVATDPDGWKQRCERVLWRALVSLQGAHTTLSRVGGGRIVMVTTTAGVSGAAHATPLVAAIEGARSMAKSAARQWGALGISVNCVSVPLGLLAPGHASHTAFLPPAAIPRDDPFGDVAAAVEFLTGPGAQGISGATLLVDGGVVMAP